MRALFFTALLSGSVLLTVCGDTLSTTFIDTGKQFVLGGR